MALIFSIIIGIGISLSLIISLLDFTNNFIKKRKDKSFADSEFKRTFEDNSLQGVDNFLQIKRKLENDLLIAESSGSWKERQRINLNLCWLNTIKKVESNEFSQTGFTHQESLLINITFTDIKFPSKWELNDLYCYPFCAEIISTYGKILAENDYKGIFKPDSILPFPKNYIIKAILFSFDYFNLKTPLYNIPDKDKLIDGLHTANYALYNFFIDTGTIELPKSAFENYNIGNSIKQDLAPHNEIEDLNLIDWRSETDWIVQGVHYLDKRQFEFAFACFEKIRKINPSSSQLDAVLSLAYFSRGEYQFENGDIELAFDDIKKAANLKNQDAIKWLEVHA